MGVGDLTLNRERLAIAGTETLMLIVLHPDAGSGDAEKLALLASAGLPTSPPRRAGRLSTPAEG